MKRLKLNRWLISIVALAMLFLVLRLDQEDQPNLQQSDIPDSDYFMQNVTVYQFDEKGNITNTLKASKMQHYISDDLSILTTPEIKYNKLEDGNWTIRSPKGRLKNSTALLLEDEVSIEEISGSVAAQTKITTTDLTIDLEKNMASTTNQVLILSPFLRAESTGFEFDFANEIIRLTSEVRTEIYQK